MKNLSCLVLMSLFCAHVLRAQQAGPAQPDSVMDSAGRSQPVASSVFVGFTATANESNRVVLIWDTDSALRGDFFVIERSPDETHYETIAVVRVAAGTEHYEMTDGTAPNGPDFYRIKYTARAGTPVYSKTMQLSLSGVVDFKFYPNPVDKLLIVRTEHTIDLQVIDASGVIRLSKRLQSGIQVVNVSTLEKGVYVLRVTDKESNRAISHQLMKN
jgi:hypothetical protein